MQGQLKASLYYLSTEVRYSLMIFWIILLSILAISLLSDIIFFQGGDGVISFNLSAPIYVFTAIVAQLTAKKSIPYLIKMGSTRKNIFTSFGIYFFGLAVVNAFIASTLHSIVMTFYNKSSNADVVGSVPVTDGQASFSINHLAYFIQDTWLTRIAIDTSVMIFLMVIAFILGLIFYRFGLIGGFGFLGIIAFLFVIGMAKGWLLELFISIFSNISMMFFLQLFFGSLILYCISFLLLRRFVIKD